MISFAPELDLTVPVPGTDIWAWVTVGRGDGGSEELRNKLVLVEEAGECTESVDMEQDFRLSVACSVSICLNLAKGDIGLSLETIILGVGEEGLDDEGFGLG